MDLKLYAIIDSFLEYKGASKNKEFKVTVITSSKNRPQKNHNTFIVVKNDISKDCYTFDFTDDKMREDLGGFVLMDANYLKDLKFDGEALSFSTDRGVKITIL